MSNVTNYLNPAEQYAYQTRINNADIAAQRGLSKLAYGRSQSGLDYGIGKTDLTRQWDNYQRSMPGQFARRNVLRSGIYNRAFGNYGYDRQRAFQNLDLANSRQGAGFQQQEDDINAIRQMALNQIEAERATRQAALAAEIQAVQ